MIYDTAHVVLGVQSSARARSQNSWEHITRVAMHGNTYRTNWISQPSPLRQLGQFTHKTERRQARSARHREGQLANRWQPVCYIRVMTPCHKAEGVYLCPQQGPLGSVSTTDRSARRINIHGEPTGREWSNFVPGRPSCLHNDGKYSSLRASMAGMPAGVPGASGHMITFVFIMEPQSSTTFPRKLNSNLASPTPRQGPQREFTRIIDRGRSRP